MDVVEAVISNAHCFEYKWTKDKPDERKFLTLMSEIGELADSLKGKHEHPKEVELIQIAGICINWLKTIPDFDLDVALKLANHL